MFFVDLGLVDRMVVLYGEGIWMRGVEGLGVLGFEDWRVARGRGCNGLIAMCF